MPNKEKTRFNNNGTVYTNLKLKKIFFRVRCKSSNRKKFFFRQTRIFYIRFFFINFSIKQFKNLRTNIFIEQNYFGFNGKKCIIISKHCLLSSLKIQSFFVNSKFRHFLCQILRWLYFKLLYMWCSFCFKNKKN